MRRWVSELLRLRRLDWVMLAAVLMLAVIGVMFIYSAQYVADETRALAGPKYRRQIGFVVLGLIVYIGVAVFDYRRIRRAWLWIYVAGLFGLVLVLAVGASEHGAQRWLRILPGLNLQPSELVKLCVCITLSHYLSHPATEVRRLRTVVTVLCIVGVPFLLIAAQPDLGTAMVLVPFTAVLLYVGGVPVRYLVVLGLIGLALMPVGWLFLDDYQKERILVFLDSSRDPLGAGWNKIQSEIAVGSGGLTGKGYLNGTQNILGFLPRSVAPTDFIYSVVAEEWGFAGAVSVLLLFCVVLTRGMRTALLTRDRMGRLMAVGVVSIMFGHIFVNVAMTIGLMPITGLPLPLLSYGGSFTITTMAGLGLVQSVHVRRPQHEAW